jgi:hypothetical protein
MAPNPVQNRGGNCQQSDSPTQNQDGIATKKNTPNAWPRAAMQKVKPPSSSSQPASLRSFVVFRRHQITTPMKVTRHPMPEGTQTSAAGAEPFVTY